MATLITGIHLFACFLLVVVVLVQSGKGADISATFGGSSQTVFGSSGGANFFTRFTAGVATVFMITSMSLTLMGNQGKKSVFDRMSGAPVSAPAAASTSAPAQPAVPGVPAQGQPAPAGDGTKK